MMLLAGTFLVGLASALCPLFNIEVYMAGVGALGRSFGVWPLAMVAAAGQTVGKLIWYEVGASSMRWPFIAKKMQSPKFQKCFAAMQLQIERRAWMGMMMLLASSTVGLPPLAIMSVISGQLRFSRLAFIGVVFVGRVLRFAVVLGGSAWLVS
ncbi:MAG: VTT domain-containing protein [Phycisphaerae bacterium]|nr:VTT domain-containing protein [Gemmatimonadaceae bacterium]